MEVSIQAAYIEELKNPHIELTIPTTSLTVQILMTLAESAEFVTFEIQKLSSLHLVVSWYDYF